MNKVLQIAGKPATLEKLDQRTGSVRFDYNGASYHFRSRKLADGSFILEEELAEGVWQAASGGAWNSGKNARTVQVGALEAKVSENASGPGQSQAAALAPVAPMPGLVRQVLVKKGDKVSAGQPLIVIEAMKLQLSLPAGGDAVVDAVLVKEGQLVPEGAELVKLTAKA